MSEYDLHTMGARPPCLNDSTAQPGPIINEGQAQLVGWMRSDGFPVLFTDRIREVLMWHKEGAQVTPLVPLEALDDMRAQRDALRNAMFLTREAEAQSSAADLADACADQKNSKTATPRCISPQLKRSDRA